MREKLSAQPIGIISLHRKRDLDMPTGRLVLPKLSRRRLRIGRFKPQSDQPVENLFLRRDARGDHLGVSGVCRLRVHRKVHTREPVNHLIRTLCNGAARKLG